jgi:hypothetical protein
MLLLIFFAYMYSQGKAIFDSVLESLSSGNLFFFAFGILVSKEKQQLIIVSEIMIDVHYRQAIAVRVFRAIL